MDPRLVDALREELEVLAAKPAAELTALPPHRRGERVRGMAVIDYVVYRDLLADGRVRLVVQGRHRATRGGCLVGGAVAAVGVIVGVEGAREPVGEAELSEFRGDRTGYRPADLPDHSR